VGQVGNLQADCQSAFCTIFDASIWRKITVEVPPDLLEKAQRAGGSGITQTFRTGLQLVAASRATRGCANFRARFALPARRLS
jgi:hypothetical protein